MRFGQRTRLRDQLLIFFSILGFQTTLHAQSGQDVLRRASQLASSKRFHEAELIYRDLYRQQPHWRDAELGLAQVLLWEGRYREARSLFLDLLQRDAADAEAMQGAATAAYWRGDFRTAAREFAALIKRHPQRRFARQSLTEIAAASRDSIRAAVDGVDDDQPYSLWRSEVKGSVFTDPLTRWDVIAGSYHLDNRSLGTHRESPFIILGNEFVLPWQRLTINVSAGGLRWPDGTARVIGEAAARLRIASSTISARVEHRELLYTATAITTHAAVTRTLINWSRESADNWIAGAEAGHLRYFDHNSGRYAHAFVLIPVGGGFSAGASAAIRDTSQSRFYLEAVSSTAASPGFDYQYRGAYTPYWTPRHLQEGRGIVAFQRSVNKRITLRAQVDAGEGRDDARAFGPSHGSQPTPGQIFAFDFRRRFHPHRAEAQISVLMSDHYRFDGSVGRTTTVFYTANEFRASLVRYR